MDNIKVGLIGSGFIAEPHLYSLNLLPNVDIVGISSRNEITAKTLIKKFNLDKSILMSYEELLKLDIDAVSVCLPNYLHKDVTVDLLGSGKHVLIEKPLACNISESQEMLDRIAENSKEIRPGEIRKKPYWTVSEGCSWIKYTGVPEWWDSNRFGDFLGKESEKEFIKNLNPNWSWHLFTVLPCSL